MPLSDVQWKSIVMTLKRGNCVPFLGAGASLGIDGARLPTATELAVELARESGYQGAEPEDFLRVCQYYELAFDREQLREFIVSKLRVESVRPGEIHNTLASFPLTHVLTTNYDPLMERAFEKAGKRPIVEYYDTQSRKVSEVPSGTVDQPVVYKLHGTMEKKSSMICTEDDVVEFLARIMREDPGLPHSIKELFERGSFLFLGYGLRDWNIRVLMRAMRPSSNTEWIRSFAIQRRPSKKELAHDWDSTVIYWEKKQKILCFDHEAGEFVSELARHYKLASAPPPVTPVGHPDVQPRP